MEVLDNSPQRGERSSSRNHEMLLRASGSQLKTAPEKKKPLMVGGAERAGMNGAGRSPS